MKAASSNTIASQKHLPLANSRVPPQTEREVEPTLRKRRKADVGPLGGTEAPKGVRAERPTVGKRHCPDGKSIDGSAEESQASSSLEREAKSYGQYTRRSLGVATGGLRAWREDGPVETLPDGRSLPIHALLDLRVALTTWAAPAMALVRTVVAPQIIALTYDEKSARGLQNFDVQPVIDHGTTLGRALVPDLSKGGKRAVRLAGGSASAKAAKRALAAFPLEAKEHLAAAIRVLREQTRSTTGSPLEPMADRDVIARLLLGCLKHQMAVELSNYCATQSHVRFVPQATQHLNAYLRGFFGTSVSASGLKDCFGLIGALVPAKEQGRGRKFLTALVAQISEMSDRLPLLDDEFSGAEAQRGSSL